MVERTVDCNKMREDVAWLIYLYLDKHEFFFSISPLRKQSSPEVLLLIYSLVFTTYMQCKVCAKKMCLSCIPWGKGLENSFRLILSEKNFSSQQHNSFPFVTSKCCCLAGKYWKAYKVCNFFCLQDRRNCCHFFKLGVWRAANTYANLLRFSALKSDKRASKEEKERESGIEVEEGAVFERPA